MSKGREKLKGQIALGLCFALLGYAVAKQWALSEVFFGKDYFNWVLTLLVLGLSLMASHSYLKYSKYSFLVFLGLVVINPSLSFYLHSFPDYTTLGKYFLLVLMSALLVSSIEKRRLLLSYRTEFVAFLLGLSIFVVLDSHWVIIVGVVTVLILKVVFQWTTKYQRSNIYFTFGCVGVVTLLYYSTPVKIYESQKRYFDPVIYAHQSNFQQIDVTHWKGEYWYYFNGVNHYSSVDPWLYYEPMVHPAMQLLARKKKVLLVGGENGMALKEVLKYDSETITILPIDTGYLALGKGHDLFTRLNENSLEDPKIEFLSHDVMYELQNINTIYDVVILDVPDPLDLESNQYFTKEFYALCKQVLAQDGVLVTQAGSPYFATKAYQIIDRTLVSAGFSTAQMHNQIMTAGEWGWIIGIQDDRNLDSLLLHENYDDIDTHWITSEANAMMMSFGKSRLVFDQLEVNALKKPILFEAYREGNWKLK